MLLMRDNVTEINPISLNGFDTKIRIVDRCKPAVSNETILATRQEFFFASTTDIILLDF